MKLKRCPFCGATHIAVIHNTVRCGECGASGPFGVTDDDAIERWNSRLEAARAQSDAARTDLPDSLPASKDESD